MNNDSDMIQGIYNYCDRWCERCRFTKQCATYARTKDVDTSDMTQVMETIGEALNETMQMLKDFAEENNIDLDSIDTEFQKREEEIEEEASSLNCSILSREYIDIAKNWLDSSEEMLTNKAEELQRLEANGIPGINFAAEIKILNEALEIINWYHLQIHVKIMRAATGNENNDISDKQDSDGSAKVALIGIDRSIAAWGKLLSYFPEQEDELLDILVHLERLRRTTENEFPDARAFIRPGFDDDQQ